ncbi:glycosyltransferase [Rubrivirga sp. IMCC43871]|uniref:glycosyltransferase n=1 Tax=Rubrivirga sp. IMCC43871 TaxID=3391575 RepID=UPI00398FDB6C
MSDLVSRIRASAGSWLRQGSWTVLDQALFAGANFLVNVLLARWLTPEAYGGFTVAFMVFLLAGTVHGGLLIEPMLVFGPGRFEGKTGPYLRSLLAEHARYSVAVGALLAAGGGLAWALGSPAFGALLGVLAVAQSAILALWLMRRACYVVSRPDWAAAAGALYLVLLLGGAVALYRVDALSGAAGFALMGATSLVAAVALGVRLGIPVRAADPALAADARAAHVEYGRWAAPTGAIEWAQTAIPYLALPLFVGLAGSGALRAFYNLAMPAMMGFSALATLCLPIFVRARAAGTLRRSARSVGAAFVAMAVAYGALMLLFGKAAVAFLYDGQYVLTTPVLVLLALAPLGVAVANVLMTVVRSAERPEAVFRARVATVGVVGTVGLGMTAALGVVGALLSDMLGLLCEIGILAGPARRETDPAPAPGSTGDRLRVLVSAFACDPGEGSEGGVGWNTVRELARHHDVTVLTYAGARMYVEAELAERPVEHLRFAYYALPFEPEKYRVRGEPMHGAPGQFHYLAWQMAAARVARRLHRERPFDLSHHITFVKYWTPSAVAGLGVPFVWGPVGGGEAAPEPFVQALGPEGVRYERRREQAQRLFEKLPSVRRTARAARLAFATTDETRVRMEAIGTTPVEVQGAIALPDDEIARLGAIPEPDDGPVRFVCIGRQLALKAYHLGIEAFAAIADDVALAGAELWMIGDGPEHDRLRQLAADLGVADRVRFFGALPRAEVLERLAETHALIQTSLHESGGSVCLEALAAGRPVVGLALGGTVVHAPPETSVLVPAVTPAQAVVDLADALRYVAVDGPARQRMGREGRRVVAERFAWGAKIAALAERYWEVAERERPAHPTHAAHQPVAA